MRELSLKPKNPKRSQNEVLGPISRNNRPRPLKFKQILAPKRQLLGLQLQPEVNELLIKINHGFFLIVCNNYRTSQSYSIKQTSFARHF